MPLKVVTIGVYGFDAEAFFGALLSTGVDTFCDLRARRAVRGKAYAFANSQRLQSQLATLGIRYFHFRPLAPSQSLRKRQSSADHASDTTKRKRTVLSPDFITGYQQECLQTFDNRQFIEQLGPEAKVVALFCVEREPAACHRSLVAERLRQDLKVEVDHLIPNQPNP